MPDFIREGARVVLAQDVDRFPHFIAPKGAAGIVVESSDDLVCVRLDEKLDGAEAWDNEVVWYLTEPGYDPSDDLRAPGGVSDA